jgi:hypothetical protein
MITRERSVRSTRYDWWAFCMAASFQSAQAVLYAPHVSVQDDQSQSLWTSVAHFEVLL